MLAVTEGNKTECARILGISRKNLYEKIARYGIKE
jgi:DNA-binding NtrC family response regulator